MSKQTASWIGVAVGALALLLALYNTVHLRISSTRSLTVESRIEVPSRQFLTELDEQVPLYLGMRITLTNTGRQTLIGSGENTMLLMPVRLGFSTDQASLVGVPSHSSDWYRIQSEDDSSILLEFTQWHPREALEISAVLHLQGPFADLSEESLFPVVFGRPIENAEINYRNHVVVNTALEPVQTSSWLSTRKRLPSLHSAGFAVGIIAMVLLAGGVLGILWTNSQRAMYIFYSTPLLEEIEFLDASDSSTGEFKQILAEAVRSALAKFDRTSMLRLANGIVAIGVLLVVLQFLFV